MARYYILEVGKFVPDPSQRRPYITAEIAATPPGTRSESDADRRADSRGKIGLNGYRILTREEMLEDPEGRRALLAWEAGDDAVNDAEQMAFRDEMYREDVGAYASDGDPRAQALLAEGASADELGRFLDMAEAAEDDQTVVRLPRRSRRDRRDEGRS